MNWRGTELHVGDMVRLKNKRGDFWNVNGKMDRYIGRDVIISQILDYHQFCIIQDSDDNDPQWIFDVKDIDSVILIDNYLVTPTDLSYKGFESIKPEYTARIKIGNFEISLTDKTFTDEQIKNMKEMLGWDVENLKEN